MQTYDETYGFDRTVSNVTMGYAYPRVRIISSSSPDFKYWIRAYDNSATTLYQMNITVFVDNNWAN